MIVSGPHRAARGFTLIEMTMVLLIIAIGSALVIPMIESGIEAREVRRAARQIASTMHYCRGEAVSRGMPQELVIDATKNSLHTTAWGRWAVLTDRALIERITGGNQVEDGVVQILFFPNGASSGAEVVVANRRDRTQNRIEIDLDPLISTVRVADVAG
ncbi:MAG TPA: GspH/FimT family pseudopilin [Candidatus Binatia bacterium]|nr:GspH/FimT family pseudopilin [Candidatus Binatia bacterium]